MVSSVVTKRNEMDLFLLIKKHTKIYCCLERQNESSILTVYEKYIYTSDNTIENVQYYHLYICIYTETEIERQRMRQRDT